VRADGYHDLERLGRTTRFRSGLPFQSKVLQVGEGEATYLNRAYHSGLVEHYLGRKGYLHHYPGRQTSGQFSFMVGPLGPISVSKVQVEVDAIFESRNSIILTEAKVRSVASFLVRQLYYPYRKWLSAAADRNVQLLFFYHDPAADRYGFWTYRLTDPGDYASIVLVRKRAYHLQEPAQEVSATRVSERGPEPAHHSWAVPQADDFEKVARLPFLVQGGENNSRQIARALGFTLRQSSYYRQAAEVLGLVSLDKDKAYSLTDLGSQYVRLSFPERSHLLSSLILKVPACRWVLDALIDRPGSTVAHDSLAMAIEAHSHLSGSTPMRRAKTVRSWLAWVSDRLGIFSVDKSGIAWPAHRAG